MNKRQKEILQSQLDLEKKTLDELKLIYKQAVDGINAKIAQLLVRSDADLPHVIYQVEYQKALRKQINAILDELNSNQFITISEYLAKSYEEGYIGTLYDIEGQGVPLMLPIDQEAVTQAVTLDSKLSKPLYTRLGEDIAALKKKVSSTVSRGIAQSLSYADIARLIQNGTNLQMYHAMRITRTEAGRIQTQASADAQHRAKEAGAEIVKQWDATLDRRTRRTHRELDGQIRELDEDFVIPSTGAHAPRPFAFGIAKEDINCRCALLQRAKWELSDDEEIVKMNNFTKQLETFDSPKSYADFKKAFFSQENIRYMNYLAKLEERYETKNFPRLLAMMNDREYNHYSKLLKANPIYNKSGD